MTKLIPQDYQMLNDNKGSRKKQTPQDLASGTYFGQMQLRGSILVIKDNSTTASGFISYGTSMSTIPTTSASGTGVYQDYSGIYGNLSGVPQFYLQASDGKAYAGAGAVTLDVNGITIVKGTSSEKALKWADSVNGQRMFELYGDDDGTFQQGYISGLGTSNITSGEMIVRAKDYVGDRELTFKLFADTPNTRTYANLIGTSTFVGFLISGTEGVPSSLLHLKSTAPTFRMQDTTASAKSLLVTVDANLATFGEVTGGTFFTLDLANKNVVVNSAALATNATDGFLYITSSAGAPSGTPTTFTGRFPIHIDSTNHNLYFYDGTWRTAIGAAGAPVGSAFVTIGTDATLTSERALTGTANQITVTDNGAGSTVVLSTPQNIHTAATPTFASTTLRTDDAGTTSVAALITLQHDTSDTPGVGFGTRISFQAESTTTENRQLALIDTYWATATDASRAAREVFFIYDTAAREAFRIQASGSAPMIGFLGAGAVARPSAYTQTYSTADRTLNADGVTDPAAYGAGANGYSTGAMASAVHAAVISLHADLLDVKQTLNSVIDDLQSYGLLA